MTEQEEKKTEYTGIFKATSIFGGVQVFNIIIYIIRSKFIAILLGPAGMGITGLLTSTSDFVSGLTNFGLGTSAVKNVAAASAEGNNSRISIIVSVLRKLVWITGLMGMGLTIILSSWLSQLTFGNDDYTLAFVWISVSLLFQQLSSGQLVVLQGFRKLQYLARANILGASLGLVVSIPVYYIWRLDGIVPVILIGSFTSLLLSWYFARKVGVQSIEISAKEAVSEGKEMLKMGFVLSLSGLISLGASYLVRIYISNIGGIEQVGLYSAGFAIINTYVGMVFKAMGTDYYPRLSEAAHDNTKSRRLINQQAEVALLILGPILAVFLIFIKWIILLFYSNKFIATNEMIYWAALGMYFKAASWTVAFILLTKGTPKLFFWNEFSASLYILGFNIAGYWLGGLEGLGISFLAAYFIYFIQVLFIAKFKFSFSFEKDFQIIMGIQLLIGILCFSIIRFIECPWTYLLGVLLIGFSAIYSFKEINKRLNLVNRFKLKIRK